MTTASASIATGSEAPAPHEIVRAYHERTKHRWKAYAAGPETLDWDSQPAPFRHFVSAPVTILPCQVDDAISKSVGRPFSGLFDSMIPVAPSIASVAALLKLSLGITAWKSFGPDRWAVRANPSSGNLHPVEAYVILRGLPGLAAGVYHYRPEDHALECRARFAPAAESSAAVWVGLSTVGWREAWKYGERAFRYCQLDVGHAIAALQYAGATLGWQLSEQPEIGSETLARLLGLDRAEDFPYRSRPDTEREEPETLLSVRWNESGASPIDPIELRQMAGAAEWSGVASTIDAHPMVRWPILRDIAVATRAGDGPSTPSYESRPDARWQASSAPQEARVASTRSAADVIVNRRSAQRFDSRHCLKQEDFFGLLQALTPSAKYHIDLVLLVHRVAGLDSGLYLLSRPPTSTPSLAAVLASHFDLLPVSTTLGDLDLRLIAAVEARQLARVARSLHCHQDIAAQACFALAMVAEFDRVIEEDAGSYRAIHRAAGFLGHVLYLEAELRGVRGTGIGCFFDDSLHELLKLRDARFQTLYHFAVGKPIDDPRIETTTMGPPIDPLDNESRNVK
jgi:SagB-type dehydrogenase family enzyme